MILEVVVYPDRSIAVLDYLAIILKTLVIMHTVIGHVPCEKSHVAWYFIEHDVIVNSQAMLKGNFSLF